MNSLIIAIAVGSMMILTPSQASTKPPLEITSTSELVVPYVTKSELVFANVIKSQTKASVTKPIVVPKVKLFRSNPYRLTSIRIHDADPADTPDDEYLCSATARRPKLVHEVEEDISDYAKTRLMIARELAMKRYREKWA